MPSGWRSPASLPSIECAELRSASFLLLSWLTEVGRVLHTFFGIIVFASVLFIVVTDAAGVAFRYLARVVCCRALAAYKIAVLRSSYARGKEELDLADRKGQQEVVRSEENHKIELSNRLLFVAERTTKS